MILQRGVIAFINPKAARLLGANPSLAKPFEIDDVLALIAASDAG